MEFKFYSIRNIDIFESKLHSKYTRKTKLEQIFAQARLNRISLVDTCWIESRDCVLIPITEGRLNVHYKSVLHSTTVLLYNNNQKLMTSLNMCQVQL